jgi:hypothetical protein
MAIAGAGWDMRLCVFEAEPTWSKLGRLGATDSKINNNIS